MFQLAALMAVALEQKALAERARVLPALAVQA